MTLGEISQSLSALFFLNDSLQNRPVALAQRVAGHARELDVGIFEHLLNPACNAGMLLEHSSKGSWRHQDLRLRQPALFS